MSKSIKHRNRNNSKIREDKGKEINDSTNNSGNLSSNQAVRENSSHNENQTEMEIYHPHGKHKEFKLKATMFEFIMMFIAISGGFFMENIREHFVERNREKAYITRLISDIKDDTTNIQRIRLWNKNHMAGLDSLSDLLEQPVNSINTKELISKLWYMNNYRGFYPRDITMTQLRNSGGLRLIENNTVSDSIIAYYKNIDYRCELNVKMNYRLIEEFAKMEFDFVDFKNIRIMTAGINRMPDLVNRCEFFKAQLNWDNVWLNKVYFQGTSLLKFLKEEYKIKE